MIDAFTGKPGSGKTYRAVYDAFQQRKKWFIIHNIHGLKEDLFAYRVNPSDENEVCHCVNLSTVGGEAMLQDVEKFKALCARIHNETGKNCLFILDECYQFMDKDYQGIKTTMAQNRHGGADVWLICQHLSMIALCYRRLVRFEIRCKSSGLFNFLGVFLYTHRMEGEGFKMDIRLKKQKVYDLYCSAMTHTKSVSYLVPVCALLCIPVIWYFFQSPLEVSQNEAVADVIPKQVSSSPSVIERENVPVQDEVGKTPKTTYLGPKIIKHYGNSIAFKDENDKLVISDVKDFVSTYSPEIYGYSYFHVPTKNKFVLMERDSSRVIYPVENTVYVRQYIKSYDSVRNAKHEQEVYNPSPLHVGADGFTDDDRKVMRILNQMQ